MDRTDKHEKLAVTLGDFEFLAREWLKIIESKDLDEALRFFKQDLLPTLQVHEDERNIADEVRRWVQSDECQGTFNLTDVTGCLDLSKNHRPYISKVLSRLAEEDLVQATGKRPGQYRKVDKDLIRVEWWRQHPQHLEILLPLEIHELVEIYPKNIILITGDSNAGKSAYCLSTALLNMDKHIIDLYIHEMGNIEIAKRIDLFELTDEEREVFIERVNIFERSHGYEDVLDPNGFSIIDYLDDSSGEAFRMKDHLSAIHERLDTGICMVASQKKQGEDYSYGGQRTLDRPRLVVAIGDGVAKIVKAKNWATNHNPNKKQTTYKLVQGCRWIAQEVWHYPEDEPGVIGGPK